jgi:hypothetical protein
MNLFKKAKDREKYIGIKLCLYCQVEFKPDTRNTKRGWGLYCSKSCATKHYNLIVSLPKEKKISELRNKRLAQLGIQ